jgi:hypothetical protein
VERLDDLVRELPRLIACGRVLHQQRLQGLRAVGQVQP